MNENTDINDKLTTYSISTGVGFEDFGTGLA